MRLLIPHLRSVLVLFFAYLSFTSAAQSHINFDENWKFHLGHASDPLKDFNYSITTIFSKSGKSDGTAINPKFDDKSWRTLDLPHDWAVELPFAYADNFDVMSHGYKPVGGLYPQNSIGWYRKHFMIAKADSGQRFSIQFDGIFRDSKIWINGFYLGNNLSGYTGVTYDITDYVNFDKDNVIAVRVDASQYEGWFYEGAGIYRHVWLNQYNSVHFKNDETFIYCKKLDRYPSVIRGAKNAEIHVEGKIQNHLNEGAECSVYTYITDRAGKKIGQVSSKGLVVFGNGTLHFEQSLVVADAIRWSLEDPYLYRVISVIRQNGKTIDSIQTRFGVRNIVIAANGVFLNGKYIKLQGVNCHQDHAGVGSALPDYLQYYRINLLKDMGVNAYRTSHNPPTPELLDACDSLGMLVMDENRLLNSSPEYIDQFEKLILRDRNHPSVFLWSIGNEEGWIHGNSTGKRIAQTLLAKQKELDPTRTSTYAADNGSWYYGVNEVIPVRGFNYRHLTVEEYHKAHPLQPLMGTEMGSTVTTRGIYEKDTIRAYVPDQDISFPWWASTAEAWWTLSAVNDYWLGGFVWTGFDYRGEPTPYQWPNISSHFGIMDMCGFPKNIYYYYQSWWTDKDVLHISPHWNWPGKEGKPIDVWVNTNADNVELFLNGKSQGKKDMPRNKHLQWQVNYEPGTLQAIAFKKGKKLTAKVETTGKPFEVVITPYKTTMMADGKDATVINVHVIDRQGREVPDANMLVKFSIKGDARIIGVGNGDPSSHEPDKCEDGNWQRNLFNGKCQVIVQAGKNPGMIKFEAKADSLWAGSTDIHTVATDASFSIDKKYQVDIGMVKKKEVEKMLGADISFLPELEARGIKFQDKGIQKDAIEILKDHGINYVRLRIFHSPANDSGYSPGKGFCDLAHTKAMAKRVKAAGMKLLLDFHYSDYWADPGKQFKPLAWKDLSFELLKKAVYDYTKDVIQQLKAQGTTPDMVQIGNEINHGILWPDGNVRNLDNLAQLINAGTAATLAVDPSIIMMLHVALGGQNAESVWFIDNMKARGVYFDVIGESYYPKWHGTLDDLRDNLSDLVRRYNKDVFVVEYSQLKDEVNKIAFELPGGKGKGTCIWEPLNTWEMVFDRDGKSNEYLKMYDELFKKYMQK
jgi:beta-galactosidase